MRPIPSILNELDSDDSGREAARDDEVVEGVAAAGGRRRRHNDAIDEGKEAICAYPLGGHRYQAFDAKGVA